MSGLATLPEAISWARDHWHGRELPTRIHEHAVEPGSLLGSPRMTAQMMRYLMARPTDICDDSGRYRYPMWLALQRLAKVDDEPPPIIIVALLVSRGWAYESLPFPAGLMLRCLRQLHGRYEETPLAWTQRSDSQRRAEEAVAA